MKLESEGQPPVQHARADGVRTAVAELAPPGRMKVGSRAVLPATAWMAVAAMMAIPGCAGGGQEELAILDMLDVIGLDHWARPTRDSLMAVARALVRVNDHRGWMKMLDGLPEERKTAMNAALLETTARDRDLRSRVLWIRGRGWQM